MNHDYQFEMRVIRTSNPPISIAGVASQPFDHAHLNSGEVLTTGSNTVMTLVGTARSSLQFTQSVPDPLKSVPKGDPNGSFHLRHYADLLDSGKYVLSVVKRSLGNGVEELTLILDPAKS